MQVIQSQSKTGPLAEFFTLCSSKEPYPNKEDIISSEAINKAIAAGPCLKSNSAPEPYFESDLFFLFY